MNAVEIEAALSDLALAAFDGPEFPFAFLAAFGNKETALKRLRAGNSNPSDVPHGVLQRNHIHMAVCDTRAVTATLNTLRDSPATAKAKARFILATDGETLEAEELASGETIACAYQDFPDHFGFFLPLAGISSIKEIKDNPIDVRATGRLNKLYVELLRDNPEWTTEARRPDMNHFMARLVFCFFAEDTGIFREAGLFTRTVEQMSERDGANTHEVLQVIFRAMNLKLAEREEAQPRLPAWANNFPYVNGGLFAGSTETPRFTRMARTYFSHAGNLNWKEINPDIFGSMIQAVADDEERGALGMHYTSVPNILKVLNPLFLDELNAQLQDAGDNERKLLNLRKRMARIRVFDPACGSGNFLVIAYKQMRAIEAEINRRRDELHKRSEIPIRNFRGIELRDFPAEIARLALIIAEFQCDVLYLGQQDAVAEFLPLDSQNWIICGNALRLDWLSICPPSGTAVKVTGDDLFEVPSEQAEIGFENEGGETYICGNPPYYGSRKQADDKKEDIKALCSSFIKKWKSLDYVAGWFLCARRYMAYSNASCAFVATSSICEGLQVSVLWPYLLHDDVEIKFGVRPFKWRNLAAKNAGVTVVIVGLAKKATDAKKLYLDDEQVRVVESVSPYLTAGQTVFVDTKPEPVSMLPKMVTGSMPRDGGNLILSQEEASTLIEKHPEAARMVRKYVGSDELINGRQRACLWIEDEMLSSSLAVEEIARLLTQVESFRSQSPLESTRQFADKPHRFVYLAGQSKNQTVAVGAVSSERREYLPVDLFPATTVISNLALAIYDAPIWVISFIASRLHLVWIAAVCGKLETRYRYSNTLGWNTFPVPVITEQNKVDLATCAENILLAREAHFPAAIEDLYDPEAMPPNLRHAHDRNDEVLERIYVGRRFRNDTERLEKLFELYTKMSAAAAKTPAKAKARRVGKASAAS